VDIEQTSRSLRRIRRILKQKVIPSLVLPSDTILPVIDDAPQCDRHSDALVALTLQGREEQARSELRDLVDGGMAFSDVHLGLLSPAAEKLGRLWDSDSVSFVDVTIAVGTLQRLMRFVSLDLDRDLLIGAPQRSILIFPEPGAEHTFGAAMAARFFDHAGWNVTFMPQADRETLRNIVATRHIDVIGLSLAREEVIGPTGDLLRDLRRRSFNPHILTIGGGQALSANPLLVEEAGVDAVLAAIDNAPPRAEALVRKINAPD